MESKTTMRSKSSSAPRPPLDSWASTSVRTSRNTDLDRVSYSSTTGGSTSYIAPAAQTDKQESAKGTNSNRLTRITGLGGRMASGENLVRQASAETGFRRTDTDGRLSKLRKLMKAEKIDYYVIPSEDAHQSQYVAASEKRRGYISGFTGSAGTSIVSLNSAYMFTDSSYYIQAEREVDSNWTLFKVGQPDVKPWNEWLLDCPRGEVIGIDSCLIAHDTATALITALKLKDMRMAHPQRNLVDQIWKDRPSKSTTPIYTHNPRFTGEHASEKLRKLRNWLREYTTVTPLVPSLSTQQDRPVSKSRPNLLHSRTASLQNILSKPRTLPRQDSTASQREMAVGLNPQYSTFVSSLASIAWLLNLRGGDVPCNPLFHAYLWVGVDKATLFVDTRKLDNHVKDYLRELEVSIKEIETVGRYLKKREFGSSKVIIPPKTPYVVSLMLTYANYIIAPSYVDTAKATKHLTEIEGFKRAYMRDGVAMTKWFAWLEEQLRSGKTVTEWEASERLTQFRNQGEFFMGLAYENISATGANAALPHYSPTMGLSSDINVHTPYLNDSGGQYKDGTCKTARTMHFSNPSDEQCEAFTRVLKGHIAVDSAIFPQGTTTKQLNMLAANAIGKKDSKYSCGTGQSFGSFLSVLEGPHIPGADLPLRLNQVITNQSAFYEEGLFGVRIESALVVAQVIIEAQPGDIWLGFERFTCVPIQRRMVKKELLTRDEQRWLKEHNLKCQDLLAPHLEQDPRALRWVQKNARTGLL